MGPFKLLSTIFAAFANLIVASFGATEKVANTINVWANTAEQASIITSEQMLKELNHENEIRTAELEQRIAQYKQTEPKFNPNN